MDFDLFDIFYAPFGKWLDSLDNAGRSIRFEETSVPVLLAREINKQRALAYQEYTGVKTADRLKELTDELRHRQRQRLFPGMSEAEIDFEFFKNSQKPLEQRRSEIVQQALLQNKKRMEGE